MKNKSDVIEIDLLQAVKLVWRRAWIVILCAVLFGGAAFAGSYFLITPKYQASTLLYVNNSSFSVGSTSFSISSSELSAAQSLVDTYIVILETRSNLNEVIEATGVPYTYDELLDMISAEAVNNTEIFEVTVTDTDPREAERIASSIGQILPDKIADVVEGSSVRIVDYAVVPSRRSSPSYTNNTILGILLGVVLSVALIITRELTDVFVRSEQYLAQTYDIPMLAVIPDMRHAGGTGYYSGYYGGKAEAGK